MITARTLFDQVWLRCDMLSVAYAYLSSSTSAVFNTDELLRAEWVARVSALDLYVHELVAQRMVSVFDGHSPATDAFSKFPIPTSTLNRIRNAPTPAGASSSFDLEVRRQLGFVTYQTPDSIASGIRLISSVELWNSIASLNGATQQQVTTHAKQIKQQLSMISERRNKIAHEGDMQPSTPRTAWPIAPQDVSEVKSFIEMLVTGIDSVV